MICSIFIAFPYLRYNLSEESHVAKAMYAGLFCIFVSTDGDVQVEDRQRARAEFHSAVAGIHVKV